MIRAYFLGLTAALVTPLLLVSNRWQRLLVASGTDSAAGTDIISVTPAIRFIRLFSRFPGRPWRATCLYRAVAACLVLRWSGTPAVLKLGAAAQPEISAHAWVETPGGIPLYERRDGWAPLRSA